MPDVPLVDADHPGTWPTALTDAIDYACSSFRSSIPPESDYSILAELAADEYEFVLDAMEPWIRHALRGTMLLVHHATRLLAHEVDAVRSEGLLRATRDRVKLRHDLAREAGEISTGEYDALLGATVHEMPQQPVGALRR